MTDLAGKSGFSFARKTNRMDKKRALELFDDDNIIQRGHFYCISGGRGPNGCPFHVPFTFHFQTREYFFKKECIVEHNHALSANIVDGVLFKKFDSELSIEEKDSILELSPFVSIGALRRILRNLWPNIGFDSSLLYRLKAKGKLRAFGSDKDAINSFMQKGQEIQATSGIFDVRFDQSMKIEEVFVQTSSMASYAKAYGDFTILDGTFCITMYDLVLMLFSNVDGLYKTTISGFVLSPAERSESVVRASHRFSLAEENTVLMTDQASAFATAAIQLKKTHLLCLHHFRTGMFSAHGGMSQDIRIKWMQDCSDLMFKCFQSSSVLDIKFEQIKSYFSRYPTASKFLKGLWDHRHSTCATFTSQYFTAGHVSSQRAESNNSRIKENGQFKKELSTYNLAQLLDHILAIVREQDMKARQEIKSYIKSGAEWE